MSLDAIRKSLAEKTEEMSALITKVSADTCTAADIEALNAKRAEIDALNTRLDSLTLANQAAAKASEPTRTSNDGQVRTVPAIAKNAIDGPVSVALLGLAAAAVKAGKADSIESALADAGYQQVVDKYLQHGGKKQLIASGGTGGILVPPTMATDIIEFLRPATTFLRSSPRRVPMPSGSYYQAGGNTGASAGYGAENAPAPYSEATFRDINMSAKELKAKTAISNMLLDFGLQGVRSFVEDDLRTAASEAMDLNLFLGDGMQSRPLGIYNVPGIGSRAAADTVSPTTAQVDADLRWAINELGSRNVPMAGVRWTMSLQTAGYLEDLRDGNGNFIFPTMQGDNKTLKSIPVEVTTNLPTNLGGSGNRSHISLVAWPNVFFGEAPGLEFKVSDVAAYRDAASQMRSAAENNETVMFMFMRHDVGLRHVAAIAVLTDVRWGR